MDVAEPTTTRPEVDLTDSGAQGPRYAESTEPTRRNWARIVLGTLAGIALVIAIIIGAGQILPNKALPGLASDHYQAVFLTNGQVYFGKLHNESGGNYKIDDIYYLQTQSQPANAQTGQANTTPQNVQLIKLGSEIHGPQDAMVVPKDQVLFWENLKPNGKVAKAIRQSIAARAK